MRICENIGKRIQKLRSLSAEIKRSFGIICGNICEHTGLISKYAMIGVATGIGFMACAESLVYFSSLNRLMSYGLTIIYGSFVLWVDWFEKTK